MKITLMRMNVDLVFENHWKRLKEISFIFIHFHIEFAEQSNQILFYFFFSIEFREDFITDQTDQDEQVFIDEVDQI